MQPTQKAGGEERGWAGKSGCGFSQSVESLDPWPSLCLPVPASAWEVWGNSAGTNSISPPHGLL